eukprot:5820599-Pleurochrysis_carterae.AAC.4
MAADCNWSLAQDVARRGMRKGEHRNISAGPYLEAHEAMPYGVQLEVGRWHKTPQKMICAAARWPNHPVAIGSCGRHTVRAARRAGLARQRLYKTGNTMISSVSKRLFTSSHLQCSGHQFSASSRNWRSIDTLEPELLRKAVRQITV